MIDEHEDDMALREYVDRSEYPELYKTTKKLLCNLTVLDINDTRNVLQERLAQVQVIDTHTYIYICIYVIFSYTNHKLGGEGGNKLKRGSAQQLKIE